ncbi:MAG: tRNA 2-thiouridine(34) synthase MnmA, partial [Eggerthellaceae bacterium]|nr:tRNA 2-thiouridine(34) synthase MnmA [Eggerthellaceae bacterium]
GYEVVGATLRMCDSPESEKSISDAKAVAEKLGIEHLVIDARNDFETNVIEPFIEGYANGLTPSPCPVCNAGTKIPSLIKAADDLGIPYVATGHYARVGHLANEDGRYAILSGLDNKKDQSYMLGMLTQDELSRLILPLGAMTKLQTRMISEELGLHVTEKPESQDLCFAPEGYRKFLIDHSIECASGPIVNREGKVLGQHKGLDHYTEGQRHGIGVPAEEAYYVTGKDVFNNSLVVGTKEEATMTDVIVKDVVWQAIEPPDGQIEAMVKLRYRMRPCACIIDTLNKDCVHVKLLNPQSLSAPGQCAVFYLGSTVLGGGIIKEVS